MSSSFVPVSMMQVFAGKALKVFGGAAVRM
jgi:hypothetical protein